MLLLTPLPNILLTIYSPPTHHPISPPGEHEYVHQHNITLSICIYVYMYICIYVYMYICICIYVYTPSCKKISTFDRSWLQNIATNS